MSQRRQAPELDGSERIAKLSPKISARANIIRALTAVQYGGSLASFRDNLLETVPAADRGFTHELMLGTLRQWFALSRISGSLCKEPLEVPEVIAALHIGFYQLLYMRVADHAAIGETVEAVKQAGHPRAAGLVNAVLRKVQKQQAKWEKKVVTKHSLPNWLAFQLKQDWAEQYDDLTEALRESAPVFLRVNARETTQAGYLTLLEQAEVNAKAVGKHGIQLLEPMRIDTLPLFEEGGFSVQDIHAQQCVSLFSDLTGKRVLDACAAPGGKAAHLLERYDCKLTAIDVDPQRLLKVSENLERLQLFNDDLVIDAADATEFTSEKPFDAILLDAPCTATGVIRRHPDIGLLRTEDDVQQTVALQASILDHLWKQLKVGGELVYITCSLLKAENEAQMTAFLERTPDATEETFTLETSLAQQVGCQLLPTSDGGDGFYFCKLIKK